MPVRIRVCALGALFALGCGGKVNGAAHEGASTGGGATTVTTSDDGAACDVEGEWAVKVSAAVTWPGTGALLAGSGQVGLWARMTVSPAQGGGATATLLPCGVSFPDFSSILGETYGLAVPDALFDGSPPAVAPTTSGIDLGGKSLATLMFPVEATLLGVAMAHQATDPWPSSPSGVMAVDTDGDAKPGITVTAKTGGGYSALPVSIELVPTRAGALYMALRSVVAIDGRSVTSGSGCTDASGDAQVTALDSHVLGCELAGGGDCDAAQASFAEANRTVFTIGAATFQTRKLPSAGGACADVRAALP